MAYEPQMMMRGGSPFPQRYISPTTGLRYASRGAYEGSSYEGQRQGGGIQQSMQGIQAADAAAKKATAERYKEAKGKMEMIESIYAPGGSFSKGYGAFLAAQKKQSVAGGMQKLVSSGLQGTTQAAGLEHVWDKNVGAPAMAEFQRMSMGEYAKALQGTAGLIERREDVGPDYGMIAQLMMKANA